MIKEKIKYDERHGGPYDRGTADSYYGRDYWPHYFVGDTYRTRRVDIEQMNPSDLEAYTAGYKTNEADGNKKEY